MITKEELDIFLKDVGNKDIIDKFTNETLLIRICRSNNIELFNYYINNINNLNEIINHQSNTGYNALIWASHKGNLEIVKYLIEHGADIHIKSNNGESSISIAFDQNNTEILNYFITNIKITFNYIDKNNGDNLLLIASDLGYLRIIKYLIENEFDINYQNKNGETALIKACSKGHLDIVEYLIENGADPFIKNENNKDALDCAKINDRFPIKIYLEKMIEKMIELKVNKFI